MAHITVPEAEALLVDMPSDVLQSTDLDALGWQVYEEG